MLSERNMATISVPSAAMLGVDGMNENIFIAEQLEANDKGSSFWKHCTTAFVSVMSITFMLICGHTARSFVQSEAMESFTSSVQSYHKSLYPNTQIDPNYLRNELHQKTAHKLTNRRMNGATISQLSIYDKMKNVGVDEKVSNKMIMDKEQAKVVENANNLMMARNTDVNKDKPMKIKSNPMLAAMVKNHTLTKFITPRQTAKILEHKRKMGKLLQMQKTIQINQVYKEE